RTISVPARKIKIPPAILNAGTVKPKTLKIILPRIMKEETIKNAVITERFLTFRSCSRLAPSTKLRYTGKFTTGFIMAKNPVKAVMAKLINPPGSIKIDLKIGAKLAIKKSESLRVYQFFHNLKKTF